MKFCIQAGQPRTTGEFNPDDRTLDEAIQTAFPLLTEQAYLQWNHIAVSLNYKYDFSEIVVDLLLLLTTMLRTESGTHETQWPSSTFFALWKLKWDHETVQVTSLWTSVVGDQEDKLNRAGELRVAKMDFISEWKEPLVRLLDALRQCGYRPSQINEMKLLEEVVDEIPGVGSLYRL